MIAYLCGTLKHIEPDAIILDVGGLGYLVHVPTYLAQAAQTHQTETPDADFPLYCVHTKREDGETLFGLESIKARSLFNLLTNIPGVGGKMALELFSGLGLQGIIDATLQENKAAFAKANGVGPKMASRLLTELTHKRDRLLLLGNETHISDPSPKTAPAASNLKTVFEAVTNTLAGLGYRPHETKTLLEDLLKKQEIKQDATLNQNQIQKLTDTLLHQALQHLGSAA